MKQFKISSPVDSLELHCSLAVPPEGTEPKAVVQIVHGMCEHKERYYKFMQFMASKGYACIINDLRGHGASVRDTSDLGWFGKGGWNALLEDTLAVNSWIKKEFPGTKTVLFGHSMGSLIVRSFAKRHDDAIDELYVCGCPSDNPAKGIGKLLAAIIGRVKGWRCRPMILQNMSFGAYNKPFASENTPNAWVCSDREVLQAYNSDPLCQYVFTADGFYNLLCLMQDCYSPKGWALKNPDLPVHFISGALDPCRAGDKGIRKAVSLMKEVGYSNTDLKEYPGMRHEILNESDRLTVWNDILKTLDKQFTGK